jgi:hypothetical protein
MEEPCAGEWVREGGWQKQTRLCVLDQDAGGVPTPSGGSRPLARPPASTPAPRPSASTSERGLVQHTLLAKIFDQQHDLAKPDPLWSSPNNS